MVVSFQTSISAQNNNSKLEYYNWFDSFVGEENSGLYNGILFVDEFKVINDKHRFLDSPDFIKGNITYDGQTYYNQKLKYDLYMDEILTTPQGTSSALVIQLRKSKVDEFIINGNRFIKINKKNEENISKDLGFCQVLSEKESFTLLRKIKKNKTKKSDSEIAYFEFDGKNSYYLINKETYYEVDSIKDWTVIFPDDKKIIKEYYKSYNSIRKSDTNRFMKLIFERLPQSK